MENENVALYLLKVQLPVTEETTKLYSENDELMVNAIQDGLDKIERMIRKDGFITLEGIIRVMGYRPSPTCPHILFYELSDYHFDGEWLEMDLQCDFLLSPYEVVPKVKPKKKLYLVQKEPEEENKEEEEWQPSSPKETSESGESDQT